MLSVVMKQLLTRLNIKFAVNCCSKVLIHNNKMSFIACQNREGENIQCDLQQRWKEICQQIIVPDSKMSMWWETIIQKYTESSRFYHTIQHIYDMFNLFDEHKECLSNKTDVALAIIFHDIIYDPKSSKNEEDSANLFLQFSKDSSLEEHGIKNVEDWILQTKFHSTDVHTTPNQFGTTDLHYFLDFDMAVLGWTETNYRTYSEQIRKEYSHVPGNVFRQKRAEVLQEFLKIKNIFATQEFREKYEIQARMNIENEIKMLKGGNAD